MPFVVAGNAASAQPVTRHRGDNYRAYEQLPREVRRALQLAVGDFCPQTILEFYRPVEAYAAPGSAGLLMAQAIQANEEQEVMAFSDLHKRRHGCPTPHVAAGATIMRG